MRYHTIIHQSNLTRVSYRIFYNVTSSACWIHIQFLTFAAVLVINIVFLPMVNYDIHSCNFSFLLLVITDSLSVRFCN